VLATLHANTESGPSTAFNQFSSRRNAAKQQMLIGTFWVCSKKQLRSLSFSQRSPLPGKKAGGQPGRKIRPGPWEESHAASR